MLINGEAGMLRLKVGDTVCIVDRIPTSADLRSGLYYGHYRNLNGAVFKLFGAGDKQQAAIDVALDSLPEAVSRRHSEIKDQMRATITGMGKRHGPAQEDGFALRYIVLVAVADLQRRPTTAPRQSRN